MGCPRELGRQAGRPPPVRWLRSARGSFEDGAPDPQPDAGRDLERDHSGFADSRRDMLSCRSAPVVVQFVADVEHIGAVGDLRVGLGGWSTSMIARKSGRSPRFPRTDRHVDDAFPRGLIASAGKS